MLVNTYIKYTQYTHFSKGTSLAMTRSPCKRHTELASRLRTWRCRKPAGDPGLCSGPGEGGSRLGVRCLSLGDWHGQTKHDLLSGIVIAFGSVDVWKCKELQNHCWNKTMSKNILLIKCGDVQCIQDTILLRYLYRVMVLPLVGKCRLASIVCPDQSRFQNLGVIWVCCGSVLVGRFWCRSTGLGWGFGVS